MFRGFAALNAGSAKASQKTKHKKRGLINIARKNKTLRRKEIVYSAEEWAQIEKQAAECHLKTSTFIRTMSLSGKVIVVDLKELAPLRNGMRVISKNINQVAKKANETNSIYAEDVDKLKGAVAELCRTVNLWLSTVTSSKR